MGLFSPQSMKKGMTPFARDWLCSRFPRQQHPVRASSTSGLHFPEIDTVIPCFGHHPFEILPLGGPRNQAGFVKVVNAKRTRFLRRRLVRIRADDFQVGFPVQGD